MLHSIKMVFNRSQCRLFGNCYLYCFYFFMHYLPDNYTTTGDIRRAAPLFTGTHAPVLDFDLQAQDPKSG